MLGYPEKICLADRDETMISIQVTNKKQNQRFEHSGGPLEFGRGSRRTVERFVLQDLFASRDHVRIEEIPGERLRVDNLSLKQEILVENCETLVTGVSEEYDLPLRLTVGQTTLDVEWVPEDAIDKDSLLAIDPPLDLAAGLAGLPPLAELGDEPTADALARWVASVLALQRLAGSVNEFYDLTARALVHLIGLDLGMVLLRRDWTWQVVARHASGDAYSTNFSPTLLSHVVAEKRTFYQDLGNWSSPTMSLKGADAVVVAPIFGQREELVGALYGLRNPRFPAKGGVVRPLEAQLVELLASGVSGFLSRTQAARTRFEHEQFFPPKALREVERSPELLEGRTQEVTLLVAGLHHYDRIAPRIGSQNACRLVRDLMERLTERIVESGGVIVDYQGAVLTALWNAPSRQPDHAVQACGAALAILAEMPDLNGRWRGTVGEALRLGIGLHTAETQVGNMGSSCKFKYGPFGPAVTLAARVQAATLRFGLPLLLTQATRDDLPDSLAVRRLGRVRWDGFKEAIVLHELHGTSASPVWTACRDTYENALEQFESGDGAGAAYRLLSLVDLTESRDYLDTPSVRLLRRAWECLDSPVGAFDPVIESENGSPTHSVP
jgi:adenylate cyclase